MTLGYMEMFRTDLVWGKNPDIHCMLPCQPGYMHTSQGPKGQKIGPVQIVCRFMVTYIKTFNGVLPLI